MPDCVQAPVMVTDPTRSISQHVEGVSLVSETPAYSLPLAENAPTGGQYRSTSERKAKVAYELAVSSPAPRY
jgi:hypothetical protein